MKEISSCASPELFIDILARDKSIVKRVFGILSSPNVYINWKLSE